MRGNITDPKILSCFHKNSIGKSLSEAVTVDRIRLSLIMNEAMAIVGYDNLVTIEYNIYANKKFYCGGLLISVIMFIITDFPEYPRVFCQ